MIARVFVVALLTLALAVPAVAGEMRTVHVTGTGRATAEPDMATFSVSVSVRAPKPSIALEAASRHAKSVLAALDHEGIAARDVQTGSVSVQPVYAPAPRDGSAPPKIVAYRAGLTDTVTVRRLETLGTVMGAVVDAGGTGLGGVRFGIDKDRALKDRARAAAVLDAAHVARVAAKAAGVRLGPLVSLTVNDEGGPRPAPLMALRAASAAVPVAPGEIAVEVRVEAVYELTAK